MNDEFFDEAATRRVVNRAIISAGFALFGAIGATIVPLASLVTIPFFLIALAVAISTLRTSSHPDARVVGGTRHVAIAIAVVAIVMAILGLAFRVFLLTR